MLTAEEPVGHSLFQEMVAVCMSSLASVERLRDTTAMGLTAHVTVRNPAHKILLNALVASEVKSDVAYC